MSKIYSSEELKEFSITKIMLNCHRWIKDVEIFWKWTYYEVPDRMMARSKAMPLCYINGELKFTGTEMDTSGCSNMFAHCQGIFIKECIEFLKGKW